MAHVCTVILMTQDYEDTDHESSDDDSKNPIESTLPFHIEEDN